MSKTTKIAVPADADPNKTQPMPTWNLKVEMAKWEQWRRDGYTTR